MLYESYNTFKSYSTPVVKEKHIRRFDAEIWRPGAYSSDMAVAELGCGTGLVLAYLHAKGVRAMVGVDQDPALETVVPEAVRGNFRAVSIEAFLDEAEPMGPAYDRVILFDVLEHFDAEDGGRLLIRIGHILKPGGRIHLKMPNAESPWGQKFQYGDLTHRTAYTPQSCRQLAIATGFECVSTYPQPLGSPSRRLWSGLLHRFLTAILPTPPEIWDGNFYAVLERRRG
jgi:SAM-dependent methyltransferase